MLISKSFYWTRQRKEKYKAAIWCGVKTDEARNSTSTPYEKYRGQFRIVLGKTSKGLFLRDENCKSIFCFTDAIQSLVFNKEFRILKEGRPPRGRSAFFCIKFKSESFMPQRIMDIDSPTLTALEHIGAEAW